MVVAGRHEMTSTASDDAVGQLRLRHELATTVADTYAKTGFVVVLQDIILGAFLSEVLDRIEARPRYLVVLTPDPAAVRAREAKRNKVGYSPGSPTIEDLDSALRNETEALGLWLDTTYLTPVETVAAIEQRCVEARLDD